MKLYSLTIIVFLWLSPCQGPTESGGGSYKPSYCYTRYLGLVLMQYENGKPYTKGFIGFLSNSGPDSNGAFGLCATIEFSCYDTDFVENLPRTRKYFCVVYKDTALSVMEAENVLWIGDLELVLEYSTENQPNLENPTLKIVVPLPDDY